MKNIEITKHIGWGTELINTLVQFTEGNGG